MYADTQAMGVEVLGNTQSISLGGALLNTSRTLDLAISGGGFFIVKGTNGETQYTRAGVFGTDSANYIVNKAGQKLQGYPTDANGALLTGTVSDLVIKATTLPARATDSLDFIANLDADKPVLDPALFDIPAGYTQTDSAQNLYGRPDMAAMMRQIGSSGDDNDEETSKNKSNSNQTTTPAQSIGAKKSGVIRIGVYVPTNNNGENISTTNMQTFLAQKLTIGNVEAVAVSSESEARAANCDYVLTSDFSKLRQSVAGKIGGMFGKVTGGDPNALKNYEAQADFKLVQLSTGQTITQNKGTSKGETDVDRAAENALSQEATTVLKALPK